MKKLFLLTTSIFFVSCLTAQTWSQTAKITAADRDAGDHFGGYVSVSGDYAIVGAPYADKDVNGGDEMESAGAAYFFKKDENGSWAQTQKVTASDRIGNALFGYAVSIHGNRAIVGAYQSSQLNSEGDGVLFAGSAYVFQRDETGVWNQTQKLVASDMTESAFFGFAVAIEGDVAVVGAYYDGEDTVSGNVMPQAGSAYIFKRTENGTWAQMQKIVASDRDAGDMFGVAVDISNNEIIIGAWQESDDVSGENYLSNAGSAYFFRQDDNGLWQQAQKMTASDRAKNDVFGADVAIDDGFAIVGAFREGNDSVEYAGAAYLFEKNGNDSWNEVQKVTAPDRAEWDEFGLAVSIGGNHALVGARGTNRVSDTDTLFNAGAAYLFKRDGSGHWNLSQEILASDKEEYDEFGVSVSIDANHAIVSAMKEDDDADGGNKLENAGSAYIFQDGLTGFDENGSGLALVLYPNPTNGEVNIDLGQSRPDIEVRVRDISGKTVLHKIIGTSRFAGFEIRGANGLYFIEIRSANGESTVLKVIKQ
ncbi:MAG: T9SS type A sorting domain-containing protein [Bacteroidales bacterium]|nr:T9SS type A sorting domain-containing protein [Bacteroidales bacterium]